MPGQDRDLVRQDEGFDLVTYWRHFAPYPWTHIRGFRQLFELLLLQPYFDCDDTVAEYLKGLCPQVIQRVPTAWSEVKFRNSLWSVCHSSQIKKICDGNAARLDRGCHAIIALQIAFERAQNSVVREIDIYDYIELAPAIFALRNMSDVAKAWLKGNVRPAHAASDQERFARLVKDLCPPDGKNDQRGRLEKAKAFLSDVADGHALTHGNAMIVKGYTSGAWGTPTIVPLASRRDGGRHAAATDEQAMLRCCDHEYEFVNLESSKFAELLKRTEEAKTSSGPILRS